MKIQNESNLLTNKQEHNHTPAVYNSDTIQLRNKLKRAAENYTPNLREIFDNQTSDDPAEVSIAYCQIRNSLIKEEKNSFQVCPEPLRSSRTHLSARTIRSGVEGKILFDNT